jgi:putative endonuclease
MARQHYVYIMANPRRTVLYTGVTNDLVKRVWQHRNDHRGFTGRYHCTQLVFYEIYRDPYNAITREKQIKAGPRHRKEELIGGMNPEWRDLYRDLG